MLRMFNLFKKQKCRSGFKRVGDRCIKRNKIPKNTPSKPETMCLLDGKKFCNPNDKPLKPIIARAGGKSQLAPKIIKIMKPHDVYDEPFVGGGAVFLKKPLAKKNYINDKDKAFKNKVGFQKCDMTPSKKRFDRIKNKKNKSACDIAYLNKLSFGSNNTTFALGENMHKKLRDKSYKKRWGHIVGNKKAGIGYQQLHKDDYKEKLKNTIITNQDFKQVMKKSDSKKTVHFLDPPYFGSDKMYKERGVTPKEVCDTAKKMKGQVIITYNNHPEVRKSCKGLKMQKISSRYTLGANSNNTKSKELLITNRR